MLLLSVLAAALAAAPPARVPVPMDTVVVSGVITDAASQRPIGGATIVQQGSANSVTSTSAGAYRLPVVIRRGARTVDLIVRHIGYRPALRHLTVNGPTLTANIGLVVVPAALEQVVVTGQGMPMRDARSATKGAVLGIAQAPAAVANYAFSRAEADRRGTRGQHEPANREQYANLTENPFLNAARTPLSTFAIDVDRASYSDVRRHLDAGNRPPRDAVRIEELLNYFHYDYEAPRRDGAPLQVSVETHPAPWQPTHRLVRIGMQAQRLPISDLPPANLVFLIDVSGSMGTANKLPLVIKSLRLLTQELREQDHVAITVYAGAAGLVLPSTPGSQKARILEALDRLESGGSTNGGAGIRLAYQTARDHFIPNGANRVILATDGDFNVGTTSDSELIQLIERERKSGVFLTVLGFGMGNTQHARMEQLADKGNGQYAYIDDLAEAQKALVREMGGTLFTLARDVKIQVEFNPARVRSYRLIGYENRLLRDEDFNADSVDAGELGAGHSVTALYDVELVDGPRIAEPGRVDPSRYQSSEPVRNARRSDELAFVKVRYQPPQGGRSALLSWPVRESVGAPSTDFTFASAVAGFGMLLRNSPHQGTLSWLDVRRLAERGQGADRDGDRAGLLRLITAAERLTGTTADARERR
jgi:Ca-activated chloride channel homolog